MVRKILLSALVIIVAGLALIVYSDPQFRLIFSGGGTPTGLSTTRFAFNGTFPSSFPRNFTGTFPRGAASTAGALRAGFDARAIIESLLGTGLIGVGVVLVGIEMFLNQARPK